MATEYRASKEQAYFAASNSRNGFHSYYEQCFRHKVDRLLYIKGGPGTGKSTLMRRVARYGEARGYRAEYYYCSSDADSLDAVLLYGEQGSVGLLDATAPHAMEPTLPGVAEDLIDLGQFWDADVLTARREDVTRLNKEKSDGYRAAYRYLAGAGEISDVLWEAIAPCVDKTRLSRTATRLLKGTAKGEGRGSVSIGLCDSVGMRGRVRLDTYLRQAARVCLIEDYLDTAYLLTRELGERAAEYGMNMRISYHPILPDHIDALLLEDSKTVFLVCETEKIEALRAVAPHGRVVSMRRLIEPTIMRKKRENIRQTYRLREALIGGAQDELKKVSKAHFELESIYSAAMDFDAKERYTKALCEKLFGR